MAYTNSSFISSNHLDLPFKFADVKNLKLLHLHKLLSVRKDSGISFESEELEFMWSAPEDLIQFLRTLKFST